MRQFITIATNAFMELVRQPIFLLLMTVSASFEVFLACVNYFGFGDEPKLVKNSVLAVMLLTGLFAAVSSASASVAREIRTGTALAVLSKPIGRAQFLLAKFFGLAAALTILTYVNAIAALLASRMAFDAYGGVDFPALGIFCGSLLLAYMVAGFTNFFLRRPFMADAVFSVVIMVTLAFVLLQFLKKNVSPNETYTGIDWRLVPASLLILFALWILAAIAIACSTRLEVIPTLAICSALFLVGLMSDYFYQRAGGTLKGGPWWASTLYAITPNWQLFWLADVLESGKKFPLAYVGKAFGYMAAYVGAALAIALVLFEDRELT
ncbi:MAG: hypothetical protein ABJC04_12025 [Verrucomicrobiota bacterium]